MQISLSRVRFHKSMSRETSCFEADILMDGVLIGTVSNEGRGGAHRYHFVTREHRAAFETIAREATAGRDTILGINDTFVDTLLETIEHEKVALAQAKKGYPFTLLLKNEDGEVCNYVSFPTRDALDEYVRRDGITGYGAIDGGALLTAKSATPNQKRTSPKH